MSRFPVLIALGAAAVLTLAACTPTPSPTPTSTDLTTRSATPSPSASASATSTPSPSAGATAAPAALIVSTAGLGPLKVGRPVPAGTGLVQWDANVCGDGVGTWSEVGGSATGSRFGVGTRGEQTAPINAIQVNDPAILTPSGLHVGSTDAEVAKALPKAAVHTIDMYATQDVRWYSVVSGGNRITLTVTDGEGGRVTSATKVAAIFVYPASYEDQSWWGTDGVGGCA